MYTQCPECATAFRVTADVLRKAAGKVRCGGCGHAFNALAYLSETRPAAAPRPPVVEVLPELAPEPDDFPDAMQDGLPGDVPLAADADRPQRTLSAAQSAALLETLDQLAGEDIRLEDTGVEWRLLGGDEEDANNDDGMFADSDFDAGEDSVIDVEELHGEVIEFSFGDTVAGLDTDGAAQAPDKFADTHAPVDTSLFGAPADSSSEWNVDELLDDAPTPVDEFLTRTPNDVDAVEVFADGGSAEIDASDVFASPATRPEDVLRFDDNTGLPENFDFDAATPPVPVAEAVPEAPPEPVEEPQTTLTELAFGDPDEWVELLDEVGPLSAFASATDSATDELAETGVNLVIDADVSAVASNDTDLEDTFAAVTYDDDEAELETDEVEAEAESESAADAEIETEAEAETEAQAEDDDDEADEASPEPTVGGLTLEEELAALPDDYDDAAAETETPRAVAAASIDFSGIYAVPALSVSGAGKRKQDADAAAAVAPDDEARAAAAPSFPESTGELEFELEKAQQGSDEDLEFDPTRTIVPPPTEEEHTVNMMIDADLMRLAITDDEGMASTIVFESKSAKRKPAPRDPAEDTGDEESPADSLFETIIMEGAFARTAQEQERLAAEARARSKEDPAAAARIASQQAAARPNSRRMQYGLIAGAVVLVLLLAGQFVHQSRADLATLPAVGDAIAPIYRAVGAPITPEWNVKGWRFEVTRGSTGEDTSDAGSALPALTPGEEVLTIYSRLGNKSEDPLPYPLITVALTDRFEEVIGSKVIEPAQYLAAGAPAGAMVAPGATFDAVIAVATPADRAAGFKLNVCYRQDGGGLRCAMEDFR